MITRRTAVLGLALGGLGVGLPVAVAAGGRLPTPRPAVRTPSLHRVPAQAPPVVAPTPGTERLVVRRLDLGGGGTRGWSPENDTSTTISGGSTSWDSASLDLSAARAPESVYRSERWGDQTITVQGLLPGARYVLRLHLCEPVFTRVGQRRFDVTVNGTTMLSGVDIVAMAGAAHRPVAPELAVRTDSSGRLAVGLRSLRDAASIDGLEVLWDQPTKTADLFRPGVPTRVMAVGDSITWGYTDETEGGFRLPLWQSMAARGWSVEPVGPVTDPPWGGSGPWVGSGHASGNGWTIDDLLGSPTARVNTSGATIDDWVRGYAPDVVLLHIGNNDIEQGEAQPRMRAELAELLDRIRAARPATVVLVARVIDQRDGVSQVTRYNEDVADLVMARAAWGWPVRLVEMESVLPDPSLYADYAHPSSSGYHRMAQRWLQALDAASR